MTTNPFLSLKIFLDAGKLAGVVDLLAPVFHHTDQFVEVDGFAEKIVHAFAEAVIAVFAGCIGGHGDDDGLVYSPGPDMAGSFEAVHFGHLDVHEDEVEWYLL
jgi:hypothetical protein